MPDVVKIPLEKTKQDAICQRLRVAIESTGLSQGELAKRIGVSRATLSNWLKSAQLPLARHLGNICRELDVSLNWLLLGDDFKRSPPSALSLNREEYELITLLERYDDDAFAEHFMGCIRFMMDKHETIKQQPPYRPEILIHQQQLPTLITDLSGAILDYNQYFIEYFGLEERPGMKELNINDVVLPEMKNIVMMELQRCIVKGDIHKLQLQALQGVTMELLIFNISAFTYSNEKESRIYLAVFPEY